jgi:hypothetical protein
MEEQVTWLQILFLDISNGILKVLATEVTPGLQQEQSPTPISLCHDFV